MTLKNKVFGLSALTVLLASAAALAGQSSNAPVTFSTVSGLLAASGSLRGARFSADSVQYIGCSRTAWGDGSSVFSCYARDATGANRVCQTTDPNMIRSGQAQSPTSHLHFTIGTDGSTCERVHTNSYSSYMSTTP